MEHRHQHRTSSNGGEHQAVSGELFRNRFSAIAREMGEMLRRMALSTNVKERLDFSCALLDTEGRLVVNAPHIPVHLGALGLCVRRVCETLELGEGDVVITNHPAFGGSHLPDVTLITPIWMDARRIGFAANRAHHAEIGGLRPGSMPPDATRLSQEGVVFEPSYAVRAGREQWHEVEQRLSAGPFPSRALADNLADLEAALAANQRGVSAMQALAGEHGVAEVERQMAALYTRAAERMRRVLARFGDGEYRALESLDDGSPIAVAVQIEGETARFDFSGSAPTHPGNFNATPAIVRSAVLYVLRLMLAEPMPLNEGLLEPIEIVIPEGMLNPRFTDLPETSPAVVGGNVETSQRLVDTLVKALDLLACGQGTMNNLLFGNAQFGYYETICGGAGAGNGFDGASVVHTHMTNTRITDPEILELRYPVVLERFSRRVGSGGRGRYRGGDGALRVLRFTEDVSLSLLSQHRRHAPFGKHGGGAGAVGRQRLIRRDGEVVEVDGCASLEVEAGDRFVLETPGGGGWGAAQET